jgi:hypothetical protein
MLLRSLLFGFTLGTALSFGAAAADLPKAGIVAFTARCVGGARTLKREDRQRN